MSAVPAAARDAVLARVTRLGGEAREVLDVAALVGARSDLRLVESVTACPCGGRVDEVLASGLLVEDGAWLRFRHEIARLAVEQATAAHRRRAFHARILAALEEMPDVTTTRSWPSTPRPCGDGQAALHVMPHLRPAGRLNWPRTVRLRRSSSGPCASQRERPPKRPPGYTTGSPMRRGCSTGGRTRSTPVSGRWSCGARPVTGCARAPPRASCPARCGIRAAALRRRSRRKPRWRSPSRSGRAPS